MSPPENPHTPPLGVTVRQLVIKPIFGALEPREKLYAHYLARAWKQDYHAASLPRKPGHLRLHHGRLS